MEISTDKILTEDEKKTFEEKVRRKISKMRFSLGFKTSDALEFLLVQKAITGKTIKDLAPEFQRYMHEKNPRYIEITGNKFLEELEEDLDENFEREKRLPKEIFHTGLTIENLYEYFLYEIFPYKKKKN